MSRLIGAFANATALEGIALKAVVVLQMLLLQKPSAKSKSHEHIRNRFKAKLRLHCGTYQTMPKEVFCHLMKLLKGVAV